MKTVLISIVVITFLISNVLAQTNEKAVSLSGRCILAESISTEFKGVANTNVLTEDTIRNKLKSKASGEILQDIRSYADTFENWAKQPVVKPKIVEGKTKQERLWNAWKQEDVYLRPIQGYGAILSVEMSELANRHETNAVPYLRRIAETELPKELGVPTCARVKSQYQNPAAEAWLKLTMPKDMPVTDAKVWLTNFIAEEKAKGGGKKAWATEAAERILRKMGKATSSSSSISNVESNVPSK